jgi:hypothetical protein
MLLTKSFDISDDKGVNTLLTKYRLASGAHILVSDGRVLIPYEDGAPPNTAQRTVQIREDQNKLRAEMEIIQHSNRVLNHLVADAENRVNVAKAQVDKETANQPRKAAEEKLKEATSARDQLLNQKLMNEHEITRLQVNIDEYEVTIAKLAE